MVAGRIQRILHARVPILKLTLRPSGAALTSTTPSWTSPPSLVEVPALLQVGHSEIL